MRKLAWIGTALLLVSCGNGGRDRPTVTVRAGESIQAAVDAAAPGTTIVVEPGTYREGAGSEHALVITKPDLRIEGRGDEDSPVVLEASPGQEVGILVGPAEVAADRSAVPCVAGDDFAGPETFLRDFGLENVVVRGFSEYGVFLKCVDGFELRHVDSESNLEYGLFPEFSRNGVLSNCRATDTPLDAAIYVGKSENVLITGSEARASTIGFEVENSRGVELRQNRAEDNTVGFLLDLLPGPPLKTQARIVVADSFAIANNRPNAAPREELAGAVPPGLGILVIAGNDIEITRNRVEGNGFAGIAVVSFGTVSLVSGIPPDPMGIDPDPRRVRVFANTVVGNGTSPPDDPLLQTFAADLVWDGVGTENCWEGNGEDVTSVVLFGEELPACSQG